MSSADPRYGDEVTRRARELRGAGAFEVGVSGVSRGIAGSEESGALVEVSLRVAGPRVIEARFRAYGCPHVIAAASWIVEHLPGRTCDELTGWDWHEVQQALQIPPAKFGRLLTIEDAVRAAARNWPLPTAV